MDNDISPLAIQLRNRALTMVTQYGKQHVMWVPLRAGAQLRGRSIEGYVAFSEHGIEAAHTIRWLAIKMEIAKRWWTYER